MLSLLMDRLSNRTPGILGEENLAKYAVVMLLAHGVDGYEVLLERRASTLRRQPGEISFPGGRIEADDSDPWCAALRETAEELGVMAEMVHAICPLDVVVQPGRVIYPFLGYLAPEAVLRPAPAEVAEVVRVPLAALLSTQAECHFVELQFRAADAFPYHLIPRGRDYPWRSVPWPEWFYVLDDVVIWGLTAAILRHGLACLRECEIL